MAKVHQILKTKLLSNYPWSARWVKALPSGGHATFDQQEAAVERAQKLFEEAPKDEQWKAQHCRLCPNPHCGAAIERVDGCLDMKCGEDFHGGNQQRGLRADVQLEYRTTLCGQGH
jgi:hypothetical protein